MARRCGAAGLVEESRQLHEIARQAAGAASGRDLAFYAWASRLLGWRTMGRLSMMVDAVRASGRTS
jgi:hypothetical protein